ncbi:unnamed protein product [Menidia menidia]|uniref:(Atlantic silverside) hypothetical protein n=1 Tax=Menidia menidia TaxID=238744 RepID=A0A8S4AQC2_9TELE|nr:unnamed protein product [Menidia menidia]
MSRVQKMRMFVSQRVNAAVEEILAAFEEVVEKYEEEAALSREVISRQHALLCSVNKSEMVPPLTDTFTQQLLLKKEQATLSQKDQSPDQNMVPEPSFAEGEEQPLHLDEAEIIEFTYDSRLAAKPGEGLPLSAEPEGPHIDVSLVLSSETEDSEDYGKAPADPRPAPAGRQSGLRCRACSRTFTAPRFLFRHVTSHLREARPLCGLCGEEFQAAEGLSLHLQTHRSKRKRQVEARTQSRERRLRQRPHLNTNTQLPEAEDPDTCKDCGKTPLKRGHTCQAGGMNEDKKKPGRPRKKKRQS